MLPLATLFCSLTAPSHLYWYEAKKSVRLSISPQLSVASAFQHPQAHNYQMQFDNLTPLALLPYDEGIGGPQDISNSQPSIGSSMSPNGTSLKKTVSHTYAQPCNPNTMSFDSTLEMSVVSTREPLTANMPSTFNSHNTFTQKPHYGSYMSGSLEPSTNAPQTSTPGFSSYSAPASGMSEHNRSSTTSSQSASPSPADCYLPYTARPAPQPSPSPIFASASAFHRHTASRSPLTTTHMTGGLPSYQSFSPTGPQDEYLHPAIRSYTNITPEVYRPPINSGSSMSSLDGHLSTAVPAQPQDMPYHTAPHTNGSLPIYRSTLPAYSNDVPLVSFDIATLMANASSARNDMSTTRSLSPLSSPSSRSAPPSLTPIYQRASRPRKRPRCSTSKANLSKRSLVKRAKSKNLPCTVSGCNLRFFDLRSRNRHISSMHGHRLRCYCPGDCKERGYAREDALKHHLDGCEDDSKCFIEARKLGWSPYVKGSVRHLRGYVTRRA